MTNKHRQNVQYLNNMFLTPKQRLINEIQTKHGIIPDNKADIQKLQNMLYELNKLEKLRNTEIKIVIRE